MIVVSEEHKTCAFTSEISATVVEEAFNYLSAPIKRINTFDVPIPFNPKMESYVLPDEDKIIKAAKELMKEKEMFINFDVLLKNEVINNGY